MRDNTKESVSEWCIIIAICTTITTWLMFTFIMAYRYGKKISTYLTSIDVLYFPLSLALLSVVLFAIGVSLKR